MKFDIIVGNPPYQEVDGGGGVVSSSQPLYNKFYEKAISLNAGNVLMIIPVRWLCGGKKRLLSFKQYIIESKHITDIVIHIQNKGIFKDVDIAGGVMYLLFNGSIKVKEVRVTSNISHTDNGNQVIIVNTMYRDLSKYKYKDSSINEVEYIVPPDNNTVSIIDKVLSNSGLTLSDKVLSRSPFGLGSNFRDSDIQTESKDIKVICSNNRITWTGISSINKNNSLLGKVNVIIGKMSSGYSGIEASVNSTNRIITKPIILYENEACTETYLLLGSFNNPDEAKLYTEYIKSRTVRYLIYATLTGANMTKKNFMFVPDISIEELKQIHGNIDRYLANKYSLTDKEVSIINSTIDTAID